MMRNEEDTALATQCLWSLQESIMEIEGLLLTLIDGLTWTTTLLGDESTQRLAAVSTAMFLLGEEASEAWGRGESMEVFLKLSNDEGEEPIVRHVLMRPVGIEAVLVVVCRTKHLPAQMEATLDKATAYLSSLMAGENPARPIWE
jgi:predicted regulator of Ras-like GTPase activity (Roadblock/LC7/MglB family)